MPVTQLAPVLVADSITRVGPNAAGAIVVNGSHGGIYAAYVAAKLRVAAAVFNDAGVGRDQAGIAGIDYLAGLGIPAAAVGHGTARIGYGSDMMARGVITHANAPAATLGCRPGMACRDAAAALQQAGFAVEYLEIREPETLAALTSKATKNSRVFAAVRLGNVRLIDNMPIG